MAICSKCGNEINNGAKFCKFCGAKIESQIKEINSESFETIVIPSIQTDKTNQPVQQNEMDSQQPFQTVPDVQATPQQNYQDMQPIPSAEQVFVNAPQRVASRQYQPNQREPFNAGAPVYNFDDNAAGVDAKAVSQNPKINKKSQKQKIILSVIAVLLVVAIALTGVIIYKKLTTTDEEKLRAILAKQTSKPIVEILCKDYDENETYEAYAVVSSVSKESDEEYKEADIYYVNDDGAQLIQQNVNGKTNGIISTDERLFVSYEIDLGNGETLSYVYTADGDKPAESEISGKYSKVHQINGRIKGIDISGNPVDIELTNKIKDVVIIKNDKNKGNKHETTTKAPEETTTEPPVVDNYDQDLETYKKFFASGGLDEIVFDYCEPEEVTIESCMIDMNDDGSYELLISARHGGYDLNSGIFAIQNGEVRLIHEAYSGGTGGGNFHSIVKDTSTGKHVILSRGFARDGYRAGDGYVSILIYDGSSITENKNFQSGSFEADYYDFFDKLKQETTVYTIAENRVSWFKVEGVYVTEAEYDSAYSRYSDDVSTEYSLKPGTYFTPMPY